MIIISPALCQAYFCNWVKTFYDTVTFLPGRSFWLQLANSNIQKSLQAIKSLSSSLLKTSVFKAKSFPQVAIPVILPRCVTAFSDTCCYVKLSELINWPKNCPI